MFKKLIAGILKGERAEGKINLVLINDRQIRKLNRKFRSKDKATDVLAFPMGESGILGEIAVSVESAMRNAEKFGVKYKEELRRLIVHGVLHLAGYDHGSKMRHAEEIYQKL